MILHVLGARPNYMKADPVIRALADTPQVVVHTGQHYDPALREELFEDLGMRTPDVHLRRGSFGGMIEALTQEIARHAPDVVVVYGDVDSTLVAALAADRLGVPVAHVESGLRSHDWTMPEERNRVTVDRLSHTLFATQEDAWERIQHERLPHQTVHFPGNPMVDTLLRWWPVARSRPRPAGRYAVVTLHRPENGPDVAAAVVGAVEELGLDAVWLVHPSARARNVYPEAHPRFDLRPPARYVEMLALLDGAEVVLTDSGGLQEETSAMGVPCVTIRNNTERPMTVTHGSNVLCTDKTAGGIVDAARKAAGKRGRTLAGDGNAGARIAAVLA